MFRTIIFALITGTAAWAANNNSPEGTWATQIVGNDHGVCYLTFATNFTETGYGISIDSDGPFQLNGYWSIDQHGQLVGGFAKSNEFNNAGAGGNFQGKASKNKLVAHVNSTAGRYNFQGQPAGSIADLGGAWTATVMEAGRKFFLNFTCTLSTNTPAWFDISGTGANSLGAFTVSGAILITPDNRCAAFTTYDYGTSTRQDTLVGNLSRNGKKLVLRGHTEGGANASLRAEPVPITR
jgi:hypothetical protein